VKLPRFDGHPTLLTRPGGQCPESDVASSYGEEFRADAVALVLTTENGIARGARDLGVNPENLQNWVKQALSVPGSSHLGDAGPGRVCRAPCQTMSSTGMTEAKFPCRARLRLGSVTP